MNDPFSDLLPKAMHFYSLQATQIVLLLGIIMFFGALGGRIFKKLKIPQVVGYIVIGIIIGSSGLQLLGKATIASLNPVSTVSLSLIGFLIGAELKLNVIKKYGKQFVGILLFESITPFFIVGGIIFAISLTVSGNLPLSVAMGLILGAICSATAPAATTDVLVEYRTRGPLTTIVYGIVAMDDAVALILYAIANSISSPLLNGASVSLGAQLFANMPLAHSAWSLAAAVLMLFLGEYLPKLSSDKITDSGVRLAKHKHSGVQSGGSNTGNPV